MTVLVGSWYRPRHALDELHMSSAKFELLLLGPVPLALAIPH